MASLFIGRKNTIHIGETLIAEDIPTKGYAHRPGWHCTAKPEAPHLSEKDRVWCKVKIWYYEEHKRPASQGGLWYLAQKMKVIEEL